VGNNPTNDKQPQPAAAQSPVVTTAPTDASGDDDDSGSGDNGSGENGTTASPPPATLLAYDLDLDAGQLLLSFSGGVVVESINLTKALFVSVSPCAPPLPLCGQGFVCLLSPLPARAASLHRHHLLGAQEASPNPAASYRLTGGNVRVVSLSRRRQGAALALAALLSQPSPLIHATISVSSWRMPSIRRCRNRSPGRGYRSGPQCTGLQQWNQVSRAPPPLASSGFYPAA
jgi:hypothetical protein